MKLLLLLPAFLLATTTARAFPPAPDVCYYGVVRDESGRPLDTGEGVVIVNGTAGEVTRALVDGNTGRGLNYSVHLPMDANSVGTFYHITALRPTLPFTIKVVIRNKSYVPIQMTGRVWTAAKSGERIRLDLSLGIDSDGDGLPDSWEQGLIDGDESGTLLSLADVNPNDDLDKDGLTNLQEYQLGTYALDKLDGLKLDIAEVKNGRARLQFVTVAGRTYHLKSSLDLITWTEEPLAITATGGTAPWHRATDTVLIDVFVPVNDRPKLNFRLYAE